MAEIHPVRAWRYHPDYAAHIDDLTAPLFDVVSDKQRQALYQNPLNSIHLSVPQPPEPAQRAARLLAQWKMDRVILQDKLPAIYVYYQYFKLAGSAQEYCRKGFIANIRAYDWEDNVILRHENTIPKAVNDRIELLARTQLNVSPTHGLYTDEEFTLEAFMDEAITQPLYETDDYQGVRDVLAVIHDAQVIQKFCNHIASRTIILADGHHRYESSLIYKHEQMKNNPHHTGREGYNFHLMYFTNTEAGDLRILPTHRLINGLPHFSEEDVLSRLRALPITTWTMIGGEGNVRHMGPVAEDFYRAYGLGLGETTIGLGDIDGVSLAAAKALEARTAQLQQQLTARDAEVAKLRDEMAELRAQVAALARTQAASQKP